MTPGRFDAITVRLAELPRLRLAYGAANQWRAVRRCGSRLALVAAAMASLGVSATLAGSKLDQQNRSDPGSGGFGSGIQMTLTEGQTFTAGRTGELDRVAVYLERDLGETLLSGTIFLDIYPTNAPGKPRTDGLALSSGRISTSAAAQANEFVVFRLSHPARVKKGTVYAIVLHADVPIEFAVFWDGSTAPDHYPNGGEATRADANAPWTVYPAQDHFFQTFVAVRRPRHR